MAKGQKKLADFNTPEAQPDANIPTITATSGDDMKPSDLEVNEAASTTTPLDILSQESDESVSEAEKSLDLTDPKDALIKQLIEANKEILGKLKEYDEQLGLSNLVPEAVTKFMATLIQFAQGYVVRIDRVVSEFGKRWEDDGMKIRVTLADGSKDATGKYIVKTFDTNLLYVMKNGEAVLCEIKERTPITVKQDFGTIDEAYIDPNAAADEGNIRPTGRVKRNILVSQVGEKFKVVTPDGKEFDVLDNVINLIGTGSAKIIK